MNTLFLETTIAAKDIGRPCGHTKHSNAFQVAISKACEFDTDICKLDTCR